MEIQNNITYEYGWGEEEEAPFHLPSLCSEMDEEEPTSPEMEDAF